MKVWAIWFKGIAPHFGVHILDETEVVPAIVGVGAEIGENAQVRSGCGDVVASLGEFIIPSKPFCT